MSKHWTVLRIREGKIDNPGAVKKLFDELQDGKYLIEIGQHNKRSDPQNKYYWAVCVPMVQEGMKDLGNEFTKEEVHDFLKKEFNFSEVVNPETGEVKQVPRSTTLLNKEAFSNYIESIQRWAAEWLHIVIPDPGQQLTIDA